VVLGERGLDRGVVEYRGRSDPAARDLPLDQIVAFLQAPSTT
jgi:prolyl-tRNA synthetase